MCAQNPSIRYCNNAIEPLFSGSIAVFCIMCVLGRAFAAGATHHSCFGYFVLVSYGGCGIHSRIAATSCANSGMVWGGRGDGRGIVCAVYRTVRDKGYQIVVGAIGDNSLGFMRIIKGN